MNILNFEEYKVLNIVENEHDYHIDIETVDRAKSCPHCQSNQLINFGNREQMIRDLPIHAKRVALYIKTKRYKCKSCGQTFSETLPQTDVKRKMTNRLLEWIGKESIKRTFSSIADDVGCTKVTVKSVFNDYINVLESQTKFETPRWIGIDEIHLIKPRGVITNVEDNTVVEILKNRNKETLLKYLFGLDDREKITRCSIDMWKPYRDAAYAALPNATVIIDKFHVVRGANIALDTVRKSLRAELPQSQRRYLKNDRFILLKRKSDLTDREHFILSGWLENYPKLALAYVAKEAFYEIYDAENLADANKRYENWLKMISHEIEPAFSDLIRAFENWNVEIMNYFQCPVTNAYTESLNNLIRVTNRMGRGYSFEALRAKILLQNGTHKNRYKKPKFERKQRESIGFEKMTGMYYMEPENVIEANLGADITTLVKLFES